MNYQYDIQTYCPKKDTHRKQMFITKKDDDRFYVTIRHAYDGNGFKNNYYHIYTNERIIDGMDFRHRNDRSGDYYYIKLSAEETRELLGEESVCF